MDHDDIPEAFWEALRDLSVDDAAADDVVWFPTLPTGLTAGLEVAEPELSYGRVVNLVGDPASAGVAYTHVIVLRGLLGMRIYFPARPVPGNVGIPAYVIGFRDLPQVRRMYEVDRVLAKLRDVSDERRAYTRAVSLATVQQATRALSGLAQLERLPFTLVPLAAA